MTLHHPPFPTYKDLAASDAVRHVRGAGRLLREAQFRLHESGHACEALNDLAADTSALDAELSGRARPDPKPVPDWIVEAAREWRRTNGRSY